MVASPTTLRGGRTAYRDAQTELTIWRWNRGIGTGQIAFMNMKFRIATVMLVSLGIVSAVRADLAGVETNPSRGFRGSAEMEAFVDGVITAQLESLHIPGAAVAVVADGKLYFTNGYGDADRETGRKVDPETTLFRIGSVTKLLT
jgi:CubicO group peptidase (beta-lactamase class C family)